MAHDDYYRTLVRVVTLTKDGFWLCVPGWNSSISVLRKFDDTIEEKIKNILVVGEERFYAEVNLNCSLGEDLDFRNFEFDKTFIDRIGDL